MRKTRALKDKNNFFSQGLKRIGEVTVDDCDSPILPMLILICQPY